MARMKDAVICLVILVMDGIAGVLGIEAEQAQNKGKHLRVFLFECKEPVHEAYKLGLIAAAILALSHAISSVLGGCTCTCSKQGRVGSSFNRQMTVATLILSWIVVVVGLAMLIMGAMSNSKSRVSCGVARRHFLSIGGIMCFVHALFAVLYYVSTNASIQE